MKKAYTSVITGSLKHFHHPGKFLCSSSVNPSLLPTDNHCSHLFQQRLVSLHLEFYKWIYSRHSYVWFLFLRIFFEDFVCYCIYQWIILSYWWVVFCWIIMSQFVYPVSCWWLFGTFCVHVFPILLPTFLPINAQMHRHETSGSWAMYIVNLMRKFWFSKVVICTIWYSYLTYESSWLVVHHLE